MVQTNASLTFFREDVCTGNESEDLPLTNFVLSCLAEGVEGILNENDMKKSAISALACLIAVVGVLPLHAQQMTDDAAHSQYILAVDEYVPAPGQFINDMPVWEEGDDAAAMAGKCTAAIAGDYADEDHSMITLGGYGGYVTFHFDHSIANISGQRDFYIRGNSMQSAMFPDVAGGASEPGIVMVSKDINHNNLPDDPWYEISGSADVDSVGKVDYAYSVTYTKNPMNDIPWTDNHGNNGVIPRMDAFGHPQEYYPCWLDDNLTFSGTRLPKNAWFFENGTYNKQWVLMFLRYGYADNMPNNDEEGCSIDISWAVDENRQPISLDFIDFVRVYNGTNQVVPQLGETSTEVTGAHDLHLDASINAIIASGINGVYGNGEATEKARYSADGARIAKPQRGLNIIRMSDGTVRKVYVK